MAEFNLGVALITIKSKTLDVQTVGFWCRHAAWQFPTPDIFPAVKQGFMLA